MTPAPTSKPDDGTPVPFDPFGLPPFTGEMSEGQRGHVGATLVVARSQGMHGDVRRGTLPIPSRTPPFKVRANPVNIRQTSDRFVERPRLQHDDREELTDSERFTYQ